MCKVKNNNKKRKKVETEVLTSNFYTILFTYTQFILNLDLLIRNYSHEFSEENYIDNIMKEMLLVSWCANARKLLDFFRKDYTNYEDDILAVDFFEDEFSIQEYTLKISNIISESKIELNDLFNDFNKISLHLSYCRDRKLYGIDKPNNGYNWIVGDVFVLITKLLDIFIAMVNKQVRFLQHSNQLKRFNYTLPLKLQNIKLRVIQEDPIVPLILDKNLFSYLKLIKPLT